MELLSSFPKIEPTTELILEMAANVKTGKGISYDSVSDDMFRIGKDKQCKRSDYCANCIKKIGFLKSLLDPNYWKTPESKNHLIGRLVCLNKKYPRLPEVKDYRPIVVLSPVYKFIEGFTIRNLKRHARNEISKDQFGFIPGISI
jgi:hypothetical protein